MEEQKNDAFLDILNERMNKRLKDKQKEECEKKKTKQEEDEVVAEKAEEDGLTLGSLSTAVCAICK